tara:strand:- start:73 stop:753 length:681 start_codon:yes stop_codon:yes gene_type:complete
MLDQSIHLAERMTVEEAGVANSDRAIQLQGAAVALLAQQSAKLNDWESMLDSWVENRPWLFLPEELETKYGKWHLWTAATMRFNGEPLTRARLIALLGGLYGSVAKAEKRVIEFEEAIEQPLRTTHGGKRVKGQAYPDKLGHGNNAGYLMGRLLQKDADIADKIGKGKQFRSINAAAQHHGLIPKRKRYEVNPDVNLNNAANRLVEVLGSEKAGALAVKLTRLLAK